MSYTTKNIKKDDLIKYIETNKKGEKKETHDGTSYTLDLVTVPIDYLYYNLENARSREDCRQKVQDEGWEQSMFRIGNVESSSAQNEYHKIIYKHALIEKVDYLETFKTGADQRFEIYISYDGIIVNGNTRMSWWRENATFSEIECKVFNESVLWRTLLKIVNKSDSGADITQKYLWYQRALQAKELLELDREEKGAELDDGQFKKLASDCQFMGKTDLLRKIAQYDLAITFLNKGYPDFKTFEDIKRNGGNKFGKQSFETLEKKQSERKKDVTNTVFNALTEASFNLISNRAKEIGGISAHSAIESTWSENNIQQYEERLTEPDVDILTGGDEETPKDPDKKKKITPEEEIIIIKETLRKKTIKDKKNQKNLLAKNLKEIALTLDTYTEDMINDSQDLKAAKKAFIQLEASMETMKKALEAKE